MKSIAHGSVANIKYYAERFIDEANRDILELESANRLIESILEPLSKVIVECTVLNSGARPIILSPRARLEILHESFSNKTVDLKAVEISVNSTPREESALLKALENSTTEKKIIPDEVVEPFFSDSSIGSYILISPYSATKLRLNANEPLAEGYHEIKNAYESGLLKCEVSFVDVSGKQMKSKPFAFGSEIHGNH